MNFHCSQTYTYMTKPSRQIVKHINYVYYYVKLYRQHHGYIPLDTAHVGGGVAAVSLSQWKTPLYQQHERIPPKYLLGDFNDNSGIDSHGLINHCRNGLGSTFH